MLQLLARTALQGLRAECQPTILMAAARGLLGGPTPSSRAGQGSSQNTAAAPSPACSCSSNTISEGARWVPGACSTSAPGPSTWATPPSSQYLSSGSSSLDSLQCMSVKQSSSSLTSLRGFAAKAGAAAGGAQKKVAEEGGPGAQRKFRRRSDNKLYACRNSRIRSMFEQIWPTQELTDEEAQLFRRSSRVFVTDLGRSIPLVRVCVTVCDCVCVCVMGERADIRGHAHSTSSHSRHHWRQQKQQHQLHVAQGRVFQSMLFSPLSSTHALLSTSFGLIRPDLICGCAFIFAFSIPPSSSTMQRCQPHPPSTLSTHSQPPSSSLTLHPRTQHRSRSSSWLSGARSACLTRTRAACCTSQTCTWTQWGSTPGVWPELHRITVPYVT